VGLLVPSRVVFVGVLVPAGVVFVGVLVAAGTVFVGVLVAPGTVFVAVAVTTTPPWQLMVMLWTWIGSSTVPSFTKLSLGPATTVTAAGPGAMHVIWFRLKAGPE
jgi:hypothetical protein